MDTVRTLLWADSIAMTRWFTTKSVSRMIVALLFLLVFCLVAYGLNAISGIFFRSLMLYGQFGQITAGYIIHAAIIIVLWLAFGSSVIAIVGLLLSSSPSFSYLLALPVSAKTLSIWLFTKAVVANFTLMAFAFTPIGLAYANAFGVWNPLFLLRILLVLLCIVLISSAIGMVVGVMSIVWLKGREYPAAVVGLSVFFAAMVGILRLIFPPGLAELYDAPTATFLPLFNNLPLNNPILPTAWMTRSITDGFSLNTIFALGLTAAVVFVCLEFQRVRLIPTLLRVRSSEHSGRMSLVGYRALGKTPVPLVLKDWFSIVRLPSEVGYGLFLSSIAIFFFLLLSYDVSRETYSATWRSQMIIFSFSWIAFFATAFFLRFLFPLVAREGKSAWYILTLPISRSRILFAKLQLSVLFSLPVMVFGGLAWFLLPFAGDSRNHLIFISLVVVFILALSQVLLGAILPNFSQGSDPEKVSTSGMGLVVIFVSGLLVVLTVQGIRYMLISQVNGILFLTVLFGIGIVFLFLLWLLSRESMKRWEL